MNFTPSNGLTPETEQEFVSKMLTSWQELTGSQQQEFVGSNIWKFLVWQYKSIILPIEEKAIEAIHGVNTPLIDLLKGLNGGIGASLLGFFNAFKPLCKGLQIIDNTTDPTLLPGEAYLYFDELTEDLTAVRTAFQLSLAPAFFFKDAGGMTSLDVPFVDKNRTVYYGNILSTGYTQLDIKITYSLKANGVPLAPLSVIDAFKIAFDRDNAIGINFYPESYLNPVDFPSTSDFIIYSSVDNGVTWSSDIRLAGAGQKFVINGVTVEQI